MSPATETIALLDALPLPAVVIGADERIRSQNALAVTLLGSDGAGRHYITALRQPAVLDAVEQTFADGKSRSTRYLGAEGGRDTTWRVSAAAVALPSGGGVLLTFEDITALEEAGEMRRIFVANVSHELRTPLTALLGFIETLKGPARDDTAARERFLGIMEDEAGRMARLVEDLLSLSRVEEEERLRPMAPVDLAALVRSVADVFTPRAAAEDLVLRCDLPDTAVTVPGDENQLRQVLNNLVENAIKYGTGGGRIDIRMEPPHSEPALRSEAVRISVRDHGEGIEPHHVARLTERFYRVDTHRSRQVGGTGLGLAIVKHIVNRHRGRLRIESAPGKGSRFSVILPVA